MKRTYQIIDIPTSVSASRISDRLKSDYKKAVGLFFVGGTTTANCRITIDGEEILPKGTPVDVLKTNQYLSRKEVMLELDEEEVKAENSPLEIEFDSSISNPLKLFILLEK